MPYIPAAPDLKTEIADTIRRHRKNRNNGGKWFTAHHTAREEAGRFTTTGEALVTVEALVVFSEKHIYNPSNPGDEHRVEVGAAAKCHGYGCTDPVFEEMYNNYWLLDEDADEPAKAVLPVVQKAREWAQAHAEKCRAQAYTG